MLVRGHRPLRTHRRLGAVGSLSFMILLAFVAAVVLSFYAAQLVQEANAHPRPMCVP